MRRMKLPQIPLPRPLKKPHLLLMLHQRTQLQLTPQPLQPKKPQQKPHLLPMQLPPMQRLLKLHPLMPQQAMLPRLMPAQKLLLPMLPQPMPQQQKARQLMPPL